MIEKLIARNFQIHERITISFHPRVTYIAGLNDVGKSTILRLLKWVCLNKRPRGDLIRWGEKRATGTLYIDGRCVRREVDGRSNSYVLDGERFTAVAKQGTPDEIYRLLSMEDLNFQGQRDNSFWFSLSPPALARELNKLVDLQSIDQAQASIAKKVRAKKAELEVCKKRLAAAQKKVDSLKLITRIDVKLGKLEKMGQPPAKSHKMARIRSLIGVRVVQRARARSAASGAAMGLAGVDVGTASGLAGDRARLLRQIVTLAERAERIKGIKLPDLDEVATLVKSSRKLSSDKQELGRLVKEAKRRRSKLCQCRKRLTKKKAVLEKKLGGRCPACGGILTNQSLV